MIDTAEGGHKEIEAILQRMREISVQGASDTNNAQDRGNLQAEMDALLTEIDRISGVTTWAGNSVMAGDPTGTSNSSKTFSLQVGAATGTKNQIEVVVKSVDTTTLGVKSDLTLAHGDTALATAAADQKNGAFAVADSTFAIVTAKATGVPNTAAIMKFALDLDGAGSGGDTQFSFASTTTSNVVAADAGASPAIVGSDATTQATLGAEIAAEINKDAKLIGAGVSASADATTGKVTLAYAKYAPTFDNAQHAFASIAKIDEAIKIVNTQRSELGAVSNRLSHTVSNMTNISTNLSAARGGIEDADFALETTNLAKNQILQQASTAMLAQANASKQNVLSLLQN